MKKIFKFLIPFCFLIFNTNVYAACSSSDLNNLIDKAKQIEFTYSYRKDTNKFSITAVNLQSNIRPLIIKNYYTDDYQEFKYDKSGLRTLNGFSEGESVIVTLKAWTKNECSGKTLTSKTIKLPYYNKFYGSSECANYSDFKYCSSELLDTKITDEVFNKELRQYIVDIENKKINVSDEYNYLTIILIFGGIIILLVILFLIAKKIKEIKEENTL